MTKPKFEYARYPHAIVEWVEHKTRAGKTTNVPIYESQFVPRGVRYKGLGAKDRARRAAALAGA